MSKPALRMIKTVPLHDAEVERSVLALCLSSADAAGDCLGYLVKEDFYVPHHRMVWGAMCDVAAEVRIPDILTVGDKLRELGLLEQVGGQVFLAELVAGSPVRTAPDELVKIILKLAQKRSVAEKAARLHEAASDPMCSAETMADIVADIEDNVANVANVAKDTECRQVSPDVATCRHMSPSVAKMGYGGLKVEIEDWITSSEGWFTSRDIGIEFALRARQDLKLRDKILQRLVAEGRLKKDRQQKGRFCAVRSDLEFIDLDAVEEASFPIQLPLGLSDLVALPSGIAVLAGASNAGKTALLLETLRLNLHQPYDLLYLMSEMGPSEYKQRLRLFSGNNLDPWKRVKAAPKSAGFDTAIKAHNPGGLTVVDFLEEIDGEYFKINSAIRDIYDSLQGGLALVALQKKAGCSFGRGGEATQEKARLYLVLDQIIHEPGSTVCALKIVKAKCYTGENPNGKEIHFRLHRGARIEPISGWHYCSDKDREQYARRAMVERDREDSLKDCPFQ